ncbi:Protein SET DOMAIN GROUP 40 [Hondaea fermentalgiana]|uniref:Protein SET DOMAIN GROUP 40 n=1 Tax=Hondaea fermentalgiana TaxID=2315210 RepID=A0A2R5G5A2_9STRA|nr:Protein SET DOMAIN GROUP 40 [Hondaea fermentalgiana]|eukprot:GBG26222.1 Protein SET DOMAIN GROUP 40 [Hondaea fermentalgiana]
MAKYGFCDRFFGVQQQTPKHGSATLASREHGRMRAVAWWPLLLRWLLAQDADVASPELWEPRVVPTSTCSERLHGEGLEDDAVEASAGVGLFATSSMDRGERLFELPPNVFVKGDQWELAEWLVRENVTLEVMRVRAEVCAARPEDCAAMGELEEDDILEAETWQPYVDSLPQDRSRLPLGNVFLQALFSENSRERTTEASELAVREAVEYIPDWIKEVPEGVERWLYANALVASRLHKVWYRDAFGDWEMTTALVPLADLLNAPAPGEAANVACETSRRNGYFLCTTTTHVSAGTQLLVHYGDPNATAESLVDTFGILVG